MTKPSHLGPDYAAQFQDQAVAAAYAHRPPYPPQTFRILAARLPAACRAVLDVGCGTGDLTLGLAPLAGGVDAVDVSAAMLAMARRRPQAGGSIRWLLGAAESAHLRPPYGLVTAGESLHWMDWHVVLPRLRASLHPEGAIAIVGRGESAEPWTGALLDLIREHSTNREYEPYDLIDLVRREGLFSLESAVAVPPLAVRQSVAEFIESIHSRNGFSRERMGARRAADFDARGSELLGPYCDGGGRLAFSVTASIHFGR